VNVVRVISILVPQYLPARDPKFCVAVLVIAVPLLFEHPSIRRGAMSWFSSSKKKKEQELLEINRSYESQALALGLAPSTTPKTSSTSSSSALAIEQLKKKYDQKINQLVALLEAKAEDCIQLQDELKALEKSQKVMKNENEQLKTEIEKLKKDVQNSNKVG
jgi:septal ring factor EnvC (AmiA/AmiB activator)